MGGVVDGQAVNASVTNAAFLDANGDDFTVGILGLQNTANVNSGFFVQSIQRYLNTIAQVIGLEYTANYTAEADSTGRDYDSVSATVPNGTTTKGAVTALSDKFFGTSNGTTEGHIHDGTDTQGPKIHVANLDGVRVGQVPLPTGGTSVAVVFSSTIGTTSYTPLWSITNTNDAEPIYLMGNVTNKLATGFTVTFNTAPDTINYTLNYSAQVNV